MLSVQCNKVFTVATGPSLFGTYYWKQKSTNRFYLNVILEIKHYKYRIL